jgi:hypothetical protein
MFTTDSLARNTAFTIGDCRNSDARIVVLHRMTQRASETVVSRAVGQLCHVRCAGRFDMENLSLVGGKRLAVSEYISDGGMESANGAVMPTLLVNRIDASNALTGDVITGIGCVIYQPSVEFAAD